MDLGARIKQLRLEKHLSQEAVANELQVSRQAVAKWENNRSFPSTANLIALCNLFGISLAELVSSGESQPPSSAMATEATQPDRWKKAFPLLLLGCVLLTGLVVLLLVHNRPLPSGLIGYAEAETRIFVQGMPAFFYLLLPLTVLLVAVTLYALLKILRNRKVGRK